jgi:hypothetical protein
LTLLFAYVIVFLTFFEKFSRVYTLKLPMGMVV